MSHCFFSRSHPRESLRVVYQAVQHGPRDTVLRPTRKHYKLMSVARKRGLDCFSEGGVSVNHVLSFDGLLCFSLHKGQRENHKPEKGETANAARRAREPDESTRVPDAEGEGTVLARALPWETRTRRDYGSGETPKERLSRI